MDLSGWQNISLKFRWKTLNKKSESADKLRVRWKDYTGSSWTKVFKHGLGGGADSWSTETITNWKGVVTDLSTFRFGFYTDVSENKSGNKEGVRIDWVKLSGDVMPVPEPSTKLLLGIGILGLTGLNRRKKQYHCNTTLA